MLFCHEDSTFVLFLLALALLGRTARKAGRDYVHHELIDSIKVLDEARNAMSNICSIRSPRLICTLQRLEVTDRDYNLRKIRLILDLKQLALNDT